MNAEELINIYVLHTRLSTVDDRTFPVAAARTWNDLPQHFTSASVSSVFKEHANIYRYALYYIFALWFLLSSFLFPRLISTVADWMSTILPHMVWP